MYYTIYSLDEILSRSHPRWVKRDGNYIMNEAISFDIETTSTYHNQEKVAFMYVWMFDIFDKTIVGRTWPDFVNVLNKISRYYNLSGVKRRIIVYVHNLAYEFGFIRKWFKWEKVFSLKRRQPLYALTTTGIEFRCSYRLSGYKLEKVGEMLGIEKLPDYNYQKVRHSRTVLTPREIEYCIHDVKIVSAYIRKKMSEELNNDISTIPLTKTGYVRRYVRNKTIRGNNRCFYKNAIRSLTLEPEEYEMAKRAFAGGFTHASILNAETTKCDVTSLDFSSSYPTVLIAEKFPMTKGRAVYDLTEEEFEDMMEREVCSIFTLTIKNVEQIFPCESYISESRCTESENVKAFNGRVISADLITIDITNIDYNIIKQVYKFDLVSFNHMYVYDKYYLPTTFVECILHFFNIKTTLKGVEGKETEYMNGKENLNALFGMCVTDIVRELIEYSNESGWVPPTKMTDDEYEDYLYTQIDRENNKKSRFLFYLWGVFCTAYARKNLWSGIFECKVDYIYSDTDSVKITNYEKHKAYFDAYNANIIEKLHKALDYHKLSHSLISPKNIKGESKTLGIWEFDGHYTKFKAIRAKSYMFQKDSGELDITVAGIPKKDKKRNEPYSIDYIQTQTAANIFKELHPDFEGQPTPFDVFCYGLHIPSEYTHKLTHTYIDDEFAVPITDYQGVTMMVRERSCVHLEPADFHLSMARALKDMLDGKTSSEYE